MHLAAEQLLELAGFGTGDSLAVIGTEKNAGKTTTLNHLIRAADESNYPRPLALTSLGRDGETRDSVSGGKKPKIYVQAGTLIASSRTALRRSDALLDIRAGTDIPTAWGEIMIARCLSDGFVELAGPSQAQDVRLCEALLREESADCFFCVDGALERRSAAGGGLTAAVILAIAVGDAANCEAFMQKARLAVAALTIAPTSPALREVCCQVTEKVSNLSALAIDDSGKAVRTLQQSTLLGAEDELQEFGQAGDAILFIRGALTDRLVAALERSKLPAGTSLIVEDGTRLFLSESSWLKLQRRGWNFEALHPLNLRFISFNPLNRQGHIAPAATQYLQALQKSVPYQVLNLGPALQG